MMNIRQQITRIALLSVYGDLEHELFRPGINFPAATAHLSGPAVRLEQGARRNTLHANCGSWRQGPV